MTENAPFVLNPILSVDSIFVGEFSLTNLLVMNDCQFPWFVLVPRRNKIKEVYDLSELDQSKLWEESANLSRVIMKHFNGDKLNIGAIGNVVSQLHVHHVVRYNNDKLWPAPIWGQLPMKPYQTDELNEMLGSLLPKLEDLGFILAKI